MSNKNIVTVLEPIAERIALKCSFGSTYRLSPTVVPIRYVPVPCEMNDDGLRAVIMRYFQLILLLGHILIAYSRSF